ncbi:MAG: nitrate- and nitrite sensing domain-containing protein, partial [Pseudomonadota bacterium]
LANDLWVAELLDRLGKDRGSFRTWRTEVHRLRRELDTSEIAPSDFRNQMTKIDKGMVTKLAVAANHATSAAVAVMMRDSIAWIYAKDSAALEWALGAAMVAEGDQAKRLSYANALRAQTITTQARLDNVISTASSLGRSSIAARLDTQVIDDFEAFRTARLHDAVAHQTEGWGRDLRQTWFDLADAYMGELRAIEVAAQGRLTRAVEASGTEWWSFLQQQAILLIGLVTFFGSVAWLTIRAINASLQRIISTICHLSVDAPQTKVPECPQADLNQITDALRILRSVQLSRDRQQEESEQLRARLDRKLDEVLTAVDSGPVEDRIEVLGLDAQSATLARGVNRLLDQLERRASAS